MDARLLVDAEGARADQRRQLAGRLPPLQVHLKETILRVDEPERAGHVLAGVADQGGHAQRIAIDADWRFEPGDRGLAARDRQTRAHLGTRIHPTGHHHDDQHHQGGNQQA